MAGHLGFCNFSIRGENDIILRNGTWRVEV